MKSFRTLELLMPRAAFPDVLRGLLYPGANNNVLSPSNVNALKPIKPQLLSVSFTALTMTKKVGKVEDVMALKNLVELIQAHQL